jgi:ABC-type uncharacterized transport system ATPase subunit
MIEYDLIGGPLDGSKFAVAEGTTKTVLQASHIDQGLRYVTYCLYYLKDGKMVFHDMKSLEELCTLWINLYGFINERNKPSVLQDGNG